jgi:membrane dipeptidase
MGMRKDGFSVTWRDTVSLTPDEARQLHAEALVADTMYPSFLSVPSPRIKAMYEELWSQPGTNRRGIQEKMRDVTSRALWEDEEARQAYMDYWDKTGVTVGCVATINATPDGQSAFPDAVKSIANQVYGPVLSSKGKIRVAVTAADIEEAYKTKTHAMVVKFDNSTPIGTDLGLVDVFYNFGLRSMQLTYNLRNLVGDGTIERNPGGLSRFGMALVERLNERHILVDVSHASEPTALDAIAASKEPVWLSHGAARAVFDHDRNTTDQVLKQVADKGGYVGLVVSVAFLQGSENATLESFADQIEHYVNVAGIDHVGVGTDNGDLYKQTMPGDPSMASDPAKFAKWYPPGFPWHGFSSKHRTFVPDMQGFHNSTDWPNLTIQLAKRGFNEEELRKILGLNFLRVFRDVVG